MNEGYDHHVIKSERETLGSETIVLWGLRLWQVVAVFMTAFTILTVAFCCICRCRIPPSRKEIKEKERTKDEKEQIVSRKVIEATDAEMGVRCIISSGNSNSLKKEHSSNSGTRMSDILSQPRNQLVDNPAFHETN